MKKRSSLEVVIENVLNEGKRDASGRCPDGIITTGDGIIVGNRYRFVHTYQPVKWQEATKNRNYAETVFKLLKNTMENANETLTIPSLKALKANVEALKKSEWYVRGSKILYNANGCVLNVAYLIDALMALKDEDGDVVVTTSHSFGARYISPVIVSKLHRVIPSESTTCVILPVNVSDETPLEVGCYRIITRAGNLIGDYDCWTVQKGRII